MATTDWVQFARNVTAIEWYIDDIKATIHGLASLAELLPPSIRATLPYLPMSLHLIISALIPIYTGSHASLSRPSSAAKSTSGKSAKGKKSKNNLDESGSEAESSGSEDEEDSVVTKMEGMSPSDALLFPLLAGCTLAGLYLLIKYMGPALLNKILAVYFGGMAFFSVARMFNDVMAVVESYVFPRYFTSQGFLIKVDQRKRLAYPIGCKLRLPGEGLQWAMQTRQTNPLPGKWGHVKYSQSFANLLWGMRTALDAKYVVQFHLRGVTSVKAAVTLRSIVASALATGILLYANLISTPWYLTNLQGFAFSYTALQLLSPTTFGTGSLVLVALFFYDIYFVFYTPLMVGVATNLDVPIKLLFPRPEEDGKKPGLAMLGLGDVVLPGIMIGLALRFDLYLHYLRKQKITTREEGKTETTKPKYVSVTNKWGEYRWSRWPQRVPLTLGPSEGPRTGKATYEPSEKKGNIDDILPQYKRTYFIASVIGYVIGMSVTLIIMHVFKHAQPALLYLVPGVLGAIWSTALVRGEIKEMWEYTEMIEDDEDEKEVKKGDESTKNEEKSTGNWFTDFFSSSIFGAEKSERNAKRLEDSIKRSVQTADKDKKIGKETEKDKGFISFSITPAPPKKMRAKRSPSPQTQEVVETAEDGPETRRRSARLARSGSGSEGSDDVVVINKADASSFIDEGVKARNRKIKS
ncbi:Minor histocompatibility antigen H13 [Sphaceloma murrayae]|uniref:Minor histocompatibility antigen H13 n=1 Tax=Sphaceloma murrayae TaxID=2082308 RepID=A0A2K1QI46_9PEZI|nr:Minor histocompatibility antigen H13 [Sphaceloma murrayae]